MDNNNFSDNDIDRNAAESRRAENFDDLQNEIAGREVGRTHKFLNKDNVESQAAQRRKTQDQIHLTVLQMLLQNDPEYAARYHEVMDLLTRAEQATEKAIEDTDQSLEDAQKGMDDINEGANKLPDGTTVFKDADGNIRKADGTIVTGTDADGIVWKKDAPSYEDYLKQKQAIEDLQKHLNEQRRYQIDVLGKHRDRMTDPDNPPSQDDMDRIEKDILRHPDPVAQRKLDPEDSPAVSQNDVTTPLAKPPM